MTELSKRDDLPTEPDERSVLLTMLRYVRETVHFKCTGVSPADSVRAPLGTSPLMTVNGLVNHLVWVEKHWIEGVFLGRDIGGEFTDEDPDWEMRTAVEHPLDELLAAYAAQAAANDEVIAAGDLDRMSAKRRRGGEPFPMRWIVLHLIEETARHNGHLDILREMADGTTGD
ncbi:MAG: DUF664 domain-containing protein [Catenulispora sp.]|nr:DUF664 domain-containing protein [Catenulispora sp.]